MGKLKVFEAFAGIGTQTMALKRLGIEHEVVGIAEIDKFAIKSYEAIHGEVENFGDVSKIKPKDLPDFDLFTYSFPCQDLSGYWGDKRKGFNGERSSLLYECEKIIETKKPKFLLLENVKALVGKKFKYEFDEWLEYLESLGYTNYWQVINAKDYGIAQNRERVFVVSVLGEHNEYAFPNKNVPENCIASVLEMEVDKKFYMDKPFTLLQKENQVAELTIKGHRSIRSVQSPKMICPCLTTMQGGHREPKVLIGERVRKLTPLECWRLMGIDDVDFYKAQSAGLSNSQLYKQAGNAIVVDVLEGIFRKMFL